MFNSSVPPAGAPGGRSDVSTGKVDLVLEGGGVKGIGLVGAVHQLQGRYPDIQRVAGTSAGAIVAALLAAGMSLQRMTAVMRSTNFREFEDAGLLQRFGLPGKALELLLHGGIYKTDHMHRWITGQLQTCGVRTWRDLKYTDSGADHTLPENQRYKLMVIVSDLSRGRMLRLPWDYRNLCDLDPDDIPVADAVVASAAIPFFFRPRHLTCGPVQEKQKLTLVDGGALSCYPIGIFDRVDGEPSRWPTLGVKLSAKRELVAEWNAVNNPFDMCKRLFATMMNAHDNSYVDQKSVQDRTVFVDTTGVSATDFDLDEKAQDHLFGQGQKAADKFLSRWNWERWKETYPESPGGSLAHPQESVQSIATTAR